MPWEIADLLANYLEVPPDQVMAWDHAVIDRLLDDHNTFKAFKQGCAHTRWSIYHSIKYAGIA